MEIGVAVCYIGILAVSIAAGNFQIPVWAQMMPITIMIIYIGSKSAAIKGEHAVVSEKMSTSDAYKFPLIGSVVLFSLYAMFKLIPKEYINLIVKAYFFLFGVLVLAAQMSRAVTLALPPSVAKSLSATIFTIRFPCCRSSTDKEKERKEKEQEIEKDGVKDASNVAPTTTTATVTPAPGTNSNGINDKTESNGNTTSKPPAADDNVLQLSKIDVVAHLISFGLGYWYLATNHWSASNLFGIAFSIQGIESLALGKYLNGFILLCGLFFYDIFWVFGTDVMVTVAKSFDAPIKLLFPQNGVDAAGEPLRPSLLGLGDIVIPGIYIALLLRFDIWIAERKAAKAAIAAAAAASTAPATTPSTSASAAPAPVPAAAAHHLPLSSIPTPYFTTAMIFYFFGLLTTLGVMYYFQAAQPALLYLVPACLISAFSVAAVKGEVGLLWRFDESVPANATIGDKKDS